MKRILILLICLSTALLAVGQYNSRLGRFQVDQVRGCAPFTITILNANLITTGECTGAKPCLMDFQGNNTQQQNLFSFTYNTPGTYKLSVLYQSIGVDDITITVDQNIQPAFEIYSCAGNQVSIKVTDKNYQQYFINFGDGSPVVGIPSSNNQTAQHAYASSGIYSISVQGRKVGASPNCSPNIIAFQALPVLPPPSFARLTAVDATTADLNFSFQTHVLYRMEIAINSTNFQLYQPSLYEVNAFTATNLRLDDNYYCFRLDSYDMCSGNHTYSPQICSQNFDLTIQNSSNKLDWQTATTGSSPLDNISSVDIIRNTSPYNLNMPGSTLTFSDVLIDCKVKYCYQVISNYTNGAKSISLEKCGTSFIKNNPTPITNTTAVVENENALLTWMQDPAFVPTQYNIFKSNNQGTFFLQGNSIPPQFSDATYSTASNSCYKINYIDKCDNTSAESSRICPIRLTYTLSSGNEVTLTWNDYLGWSAGVQRYRVEKYNRAGSLIKSVDVGNATTLVDKDIDNVNQIVSYRVFAIANQSGLANSISNYAEVYKTVNLFYPTAFTPDNKGPKENEAFSVSGQFIDKLELSIFDRWGSLIFYSDKKEAWDGTQSGQPMPIATYVWTANVTDISGQTFKRSGTVVLLRK